VATFITTSAISHHLEELIKNASERVILISPYLKLNDRVKELLEDKNRFKIDIRIVYGKSELQPAEINWIKQLTYVRTSFCKNLHAKCYLSEDTCIITSLNLYEFSQVNNNEMGVLIQKESDDNMYKDAYEEAQRIIRISDETTIRSAATRYDLESINEIKTQDDAKNDQLLTTSKLAKQIGINTKELQAKLEAAGYIEQKEETVNLTRKGIELGAQPKSGRFGDYILWPCGLNL